MVKRITFFMFLVLMGMLAGRQAIAQSSPIATAVSSRDMAVRYNRRVTAEAPDEQLDSIIAYNYNEVSENWDVPFTKKSFVYDADDRLSAYLLSSWDNGNQQWINLWKETYHYEEERLSTFEASVWKDGHWNNEKKVGYSYNDEGLVKEERGYFWSYIVNDWSLGDKWTYRYNEEGKPLQDSMYWWYEDSEMWEPQKKLDYTYLNGLTHYIYTSEWDVKEWKNSEKKWFLYGNINWELVSISTYAWDAAAIDWALTEMEGFGYSDDFYMESSSVGYKDVASKAWTKFLRENYTYNYEVPKEAIRIPYEEGAYDAFHFHHKVTGITMEKLNMETTDYEPYREIVYYYSDADRVTGTENARADLLAIDLFPNPARESFQVVFPEWQSEAHVQLLNVQGNEVVQAYVRSGEAIDIGMLPSGVYMYRVLAGAQMTTGKLVIE